MTMTNLAKPSVPGVPRHIPVMQQEIVEALQPGPGKLFVDATLGRAGHTQLLLQAGATVIGVDQDPQAIREVRAMQLVGLELVEGNFRDLHNFLPSVLAGRQLNGVLMDLGVSSAQLDEVERGFSYHHDAPLDMRMSAQGEGAFELINDTDEAELARILFSYGEERHSRRIARAIVEARATKSIGTTTELADIIKRSYPGGHSRGIHPARRSFQAFRIAVNDELAALRDGLVASEELLSPGGRLAVLSFHSLEDRIVKHFLKNSNSLRALHKRPLEPSEAEIGSNPRARSAKLRVGEKKAA